MYEAKKSSVSKKTLIFFAPNPIKNLGQKIDISTRNMFITINLSLLDYHWRPRVALSKRKQKKDIQQQLRHVKFGKLKSFLCGFWFNT